MNAHCTLVDVGFAETRSSWTEAVVAIEHARRCGDVYDYLSSERLFCCGNIKLYLYKCQLRLWDLFCAFDASGLRNTEGWFATTRPSLFALEEDNQSSHLDILPNPTIATMTRMVNDYRIVDPRLIYKTVCLEPNSGKILMWGNRVREAEADQ